MPNFLVPNLPDVVDINQAEPDAVDFKVLGYRRTGVLTGGAVSAINAASVQVDAGTGVLDDVPISWPSATVPISPGTGQPRMDMVVVNGAGIPMVLAGGPSDNPRYGSNVDPSLYVTLGGVFVQAGTTTIIASALTPKAPSMPQSFRRVYADDDDVAIEVKGEAGKVFTVDAAGGHAWGTNTLKKIANNAMEMVSSLYMRASDSVSTVLTLRARPTDPHAQHVLRFERNDGAYLASVDGVGRANFANLINGTGQPNGVVTALRGALYIDLSAAGTSLGLWQKGGDDNTNTGWVSFRVYVANDSGIPTGTILSFIGASGSVPSGYIVPVGQWISTTGDTAALAALIGGRYGSSGGNVLMPDLRDCALIMAGLSFGLGARVGSTSVTLTEDHMPYHSHDVADPGHRHPQPGPYWYWRSNQFHNNKHPFPSTSLVYEHLYRQPDEFDTTAVTNIGIWGRGGGQGFSLMQPSHAMTFMVKL